MIIPLRPGRMKLKGWPRKRLLVNIEDYVSMGGDELRMIRGNGGRVVEETRTFHGL